MTALSSKIDANQIANFSDSMTAYTTGVSDLHFCSWPVY